MLLHTIIVINKQVWVNNSQLPVDHVLAGSFESAMRVSGIPALNCMLKGLLVVIVVCRLNDLLRARFDSLIHVQFLMTKNNVACVMKT